LGKKKLVTSCKKQERSFVVGYFSCIVNVFDYNSSSQASANYRLVSRKWFLNYFRCVFFCISDWYLHLS